MNARKQKDMSLLVITPKWKQPKFPEKARVAGVEGGEWS